MESQKGHQSVAKLHLVKQYLKKFGYLNQVNDDEFDDLLESAIRTYQQNFHLEVTGRLDKRTVNQMMKPRCGVPDIFNSTKGYNSSKSSDGVAKADYSFFPGAPKWSKKHLKYTFGATVQVAGAESIRSVCKQSFQKWAQVTEFTFEEVPNAADADIKIAFYQLEHGDDEPFDGPGGIFAHGFRPTIGMLHFDADETWSSSPGTLELDLESVAVHEIGHLLGLGHSGDLRSCIHTLIMERKKGICKRMTSKESVTSMEFDQRPHITKSIVEKKMVTVLIVLANKGSVRGF